MAVSSTRTHQVNSNTILPAVEREIVDVVSVCILFRDTRGYYFGGCRLFELKLLGVR